MDFIDEEKIPNIEELTDALANQELKEYTYNAKVQVRPIKLGEYNLYRGWEISADDNPDDDGFLCLREDGSATWVPKDLFLNTHVDGAYHSVSGMSFGAAMEVLKAGGKVARPGWNGTGMHLEAQFPDKNSKVTFPYLVMTIPGCEEGVRRLPWQPAQVDIFQDDWMAVE